jgi:4'-phosphopantetheinyl transferase EntD
VIEEIVPSTVAAVEAFDDHPQATLYPEEESVIARALDKRRREFTNARYCARTALVALGLPPAPIVPGHRGAPGWPEAVVGSMTHCAGYCAAALARGRDVRTIGIDAEVHEALPQGVLDRVSIAPEQARLRRLAADEPGVCWDRLLFSAKEAIYKAWFPLTRRWLHFEQADVELDPAGTFTARLLVEGPVPGFAGRWLVRDGLVLTAITVAASE